MRSIIQNSWRDLSNINVRVKEAPIFILGNQKSGTSAIAGLLAELTNSSVSIDLRKDVWDPKFHEILQGEISFQKFLDRHRVDFSKDIVKEPNLTFLYQELLQKFPNSKFIFVIRDPRDNIKSILNRLSIPGNLKILTSEYMGVIPQSWKSILQNKGLKIENSDFTNYIESLANRWNLASNILLKNSGKVSDRICENKLKPGSIAFIRYEDFTEQKHIELVRLSLLLDLKPVNDITKKVNIQFQPRGKGSFTWVQKNINWEDFFGRENLSKIEDICSNNMKAFGYDTFNDLT